MQDKRDAVSATKYVTKSNDWRYSEAGV